MLVKAASKELDAGFCGFYLPRLSESHEESGPILVSSGKNQLLCHNAINLQYDIARSTGRGASLSSQAPTSSLPGLASVSQREKQTELKSLTNAACPY
jgi:hypothetical protein